MTKRARATHVESVVATLLRVSALRSRVTSKAWDYGWSQESYRRSPDAAITHDANTTIGLTSEGVNALEASVQQIRRMAPVSEVYDSEELWRLVATLIAQLPLDGAASELEALIRVRLARLLSPPPCLIVFPVANIALDGVLAVGNVVLGSMSDEWLARVEQGLGRAPLLGKLPPTWWLPSSAPDANGTVETPIVFAWWGPEQLDRAEKRAEEAFDDLVALALMLEPDLDAQRVFSLRGDSNRPGVRGLVADRRSLQTLASAGTPELMSELGAGVHVDGVLGTSVSHHWWGIDPFPIAALIRDDERSRIVGTVIQPAGRLQQRLLTAARWHAKAHWSRTTEDAMLALGIAMDAMLSESGPSPGRVIAERYAYLEPSAHVRELRYRYLLSEVYAARSSVAHGGKSASLSDFRFVRKVASEVRDTFQRLFRLAEEASAVSEADHSALFTRLKWGQ